MTGRTGLQRWAQGTVADHQQLAQLCGPGVEEQVDFAHFPVDRMMPIGADVYRIMKAVGFV